VGFDVDDGIIRTPPGTTTNPILPPLAQVWQGVALGAGIVIVNFLQAVTHHLLYYVTMKAGWNCRIAFTGAFVRVTKTFVGVLLHPRLPSSHQMIILHNRQTQHTWAHA